jgi:hypothetical protein
VAAPSLGLATAVLAFLGFAFSGVEGSSAGVYDLDFQVGCQPHVYVPFPDCDVASDLRCCACACPCGDKSLVAAQKTWPVPRVPETDVATALSAQTPTVTHASPPGAVDLAKRLKNAGAKMYGAFWCSHCFEQKQVSPA